MLNDQVSFSLIPLHGIRDFLSNEYAILMANIFVTTQTTP